MIKKIFLALVCLGVALAACVPQETPAVGMPNAGIANPASVYCEQNGGKLEIRSDAAGNQTGICIFPDGGECEEWAYFRGECAPSNPAPEPTNAMITTPESTEETIDDWKVYRNETMGVRFQYPADAAISLDESAYTIYVNGPVVDNNAWPVLMISYPQDREEFQLPANADLKHWLIDHNLYVDQPQPDTIIAGETAIHIRYPGGQQSYANDRFFFVHNGQIFVITILHTGEKEDWTIYDRFLQSFEFK